MRLNLPQPPPLPARDVALLMDDDDSDKEVESLGKKGSVDLAREELREAARKTKGKEKIEASLERSRGGPGYFSFVIGRGIGFTKNTGGWLYKLARLVAGNNIVWLFAFFNSLKLVFRFENYVRNYIIYFISISFHVTWDMIHLCYKFFYYLEDYLLV
jgi:hypothetical protein